MRIVEQYLLQLNNEKRRLMRAAAILTALSFLVVIGVSWNLRITAITIANGATCGRQEHRHDAQCIAENVAVCGYEQAAVPVILEETTTENVAEETAVEENGENDELNPSAGAEPIAEQHIHTEDCYVQVYSCGLEEHIHNISCYSDETVDIETAEIWEKDLPQLTGRWAEDVVLVAQSQLGNKESEKNYMVAADGQTRNGITRYGQWYGNPYGDWSAMFALFCLEYAQIPQQALPHSPGADNMMHMAEDLQIVRQPDENMEKAGNLLFADTDGNGNADRVIIITQPVGDKFAAIGGDIENSVTEFIISKEEISVLGYIDIAKLQTAFAENGRETLPDSTESGENADQTVDGDTQQTDEIQQKEEIVLNAVFTDDGKIRLSAEVNTAETEMYLWQWQYSEDGSEPWTDIAGAMDFVLELENTEENYMRYYRLQGRKMQMMLMTLELVEEEPQTEPEEEAEDDIINSEAIAPFRIDKNNNVYTIEVYALPVDTNGNRLTNIAVTKLDSLTVNNDTKKEVKNSFDDNLGEYKSAYFGTENSVSKDNNVTLDNIRYVWRYTRYYGSYYLAYQKTDNTQNQRWMQNANTGISLYLRYVPQFTVTLQSDGFESVTERVQYNDTPEFAEQPQWQKEDYTLIGWAAGGNVYTFEEILQRPVTQNITYTATWAENPTITFDMGEYADSLYPVDPVEVLYGGTIQQLPTPQWKFNSVAMAFGGWYLNQELTQEVTADYEYKEDTILYAKWSPKDEGYYVYFMDFERENATPLVLVTYSVTEGKTTSVYVPANVPEGKEWDGKWYLDSGKSVEYNFSIPVSQMTDYLTGALGRDLYLYPGTKDVCRAIFVTYGTRIDPVTAVKGDTIDLGRYVPQRNGYNFDGWTLADGTPVSGVYQLNETTTFVAKWTADYVPFEAILRIENANDTGMTQANILGTWYAKAGSQIKVKSTYTDSGDSRTGTHKVVCVLDGVEYPVYTDAGLTTEATLSDVYEKYFIYNNTGTKWTDEVNWDDVYLNGELPYSTRPISSAGDTIINFDYMRVRNDIVFTIINSDTNGGYIDVYKLKENGLITGSVIYTGTVPTAVGHNVSAKGVSANNISWSYTAAAGSSGNNLYTLHDMKYGQRIFEVYPVGGSWLTPRGEAFHQYAVESGEYFSSRRQDLTEDFFKGSGRGLKPYSLVTEFRTQEFIALMYAVECLEEETPDFVYNNIGYKVDTELCEVVKHTGYFGIKALEGCVPGINMLGQYNGNNKYYTANSITWENYNVAVTDDTVVGDSGKGNPKAETLFGTTYWPHYSRYNGVTGLKTFAKMYIFYYNRLKMNIQFNFGYDADGNGATETAKYENIPYGEKIAEYQFGMKDFQRNPLLERDGYEFAGWYDANGFVLEAEDWDSIVATGDSTNNTMIFFAKWEKISNNIVEYYEDRSAEEPFEQHYFDDGQLVQYPTMEVYPDGWVWQEYGEGSFKRFDWDVPMYGEYGVQETRIINGEERVVNVIRIYGTWDESHTRVIYDPNQPDGGIPGTAPVDYNEYTIWQSAVPVASKGNTENADPAMVFVGWKLDRNDVVYHPGDHVSVQWPRTMKFTAQWAKAEDVVYLLYDPNGGTPENRYPNDSGFPYKKNATASVWENTTSDGQPWFTRTGYIFKGWNTLPDGTGTAFAPDSTIVLTEPLTVLYAQWEKEVYNLSVYKTDSDNSKPLRDAQFGLYKLVDGRYLSVDSFVTGADGHIAFQNLEVDTVYKLIEEKPPDGYAIITKEVMFGIKPDENTNTLSFVFYDDIGNTISAPGGVWGEYITAARLLTITVKNLRGYELPSTGGTGGIIHILFGIALITAPFVYIFSQRRKRERRLRE